MGERDVEDEMEERFKRNTQDEDLISIDFKDGY